MTAPVHRATPRQTPRAATRPTPRIATRSMPRLAPRLALVLAAAGAAALPILAWAEADLPAQENTAVLANTAASAALRCEIALDAVRGGTEITGTVTSDRSTVAGDYRMAITSRSAGGSATIRQSGSFQAGPGAPAILGQTRLMGPPASQDVELTVTVQGARLPCAASL